MLDALFMILYGVSEADVAHILNSFPIVRQQEGAAFGDFRTKELVLEGMRQIAAGCLAIGNVHPNRS